MYTIIPIPNIFKLKIAEIKNLISAILFILLMQGDIFVYILQNLINMFSYFYGVGIDVFHKMGNYSFHKTLLTNHTAFADYITTHNVQNLNFKIMRYFQQSYRKSQFYVCYWFCPFHK